MEEQHENAHGKAAMQDGEKGGISEYTGVPDPPEDDFDDLHGMNHEQYGQRSD